MVLELILSKTESSLQGAQTHGRLIRQTNIRAMMCPSLRRTMHVRFVLIFKLIQIRILEYRVRHESHSAFGFGEGEMAPSA
jgi:hypothetical protein